jgi:hypothetical protein
MLSELFNRSLAFSPPGNYATVGKCDLDRRIARHHPQSMLGQLQIADNFRPEHARDIRCGGGLAPRRDFLGDATTADYLSSFQNQSAQSGPGKIGRSGESVVAAANDNCVINLIVGRPHLLLTPGHYYRARGIHTLAQRHKRMELNFELFFGIVP